MTWDQPHSDTDIDALTGRVRELEALLAIARAEVTSERELRTAAEMGLGVAYAARDEAEGERNYWHHKVDDLRSALVAVLEVR